MAVATASSTLNVSGTTTTAAVNCGGTLTMGSGQRFLADPGTLAATGIGFTGANAGTGAYISTANVMAVGSAANRIVRFDSTATPFDVPVNFGSSTNLLHRLTIAAAAVQTGNYQVLSSDTFIIMNGSGLTVTLEASPQTNRILQIRNIDAGTCTIARNGKQIDGASADTTMATLETVQLRYDGTGWRIVGRGV